MANLNPYEKTVQTYSSVDIAGWEVMSFPDEESVTAELRGRTFMVSPVQETAGHEQNHHEVLIGIAGPTDVRVQIHMGHAHNGTLFDRVVSTYHYSIDWKNQQPGAFNRKFEAAYGGRCASWWLLEVVEGVTYTGLQHKYFESKTSWLHGSAQAVEYMGGKMRYQVALPPNYDPDEDRKYPVVISVDGSHRAGQSGAIMGQTSPGSIMTKSENTYTQYPAIHVACQIPTSGFTEELPPFETEMPYHDGWSRYYSGKRYGGIGIRKVVEHILGTMQADPDRVYMSGFSGGGIMSFEMMKYGRDIFAAIVPVGGWAIGRAYENVFANPYWDDVPPGEIDSMRDRLKKEIHQARHLSTIVAAGSSDNMKYGTEAYYEVGTDEFGIDCQFKLYPTSHGGSPKLCWRDPENVAWLFSQVRDSVIPPDRYADGNYDKPIEPVNYYQCRLAAQGHGYYVVTVNGNARTFHRTEREAAAQAHNLKAENPALDIAYTHDYRVDVDLIKPEISPCE